MENKNRVIWIDQLRALAFYAVILGHLNVGDNLRVWLYSFHMPLFFMISGFILNIEKIQKASFRDYASKLSKKLLVPYMWLQMFSFILRFAVSLIRNKPVSVKEYLFGILIGHSSIADAPSNPLYYALLLFLAQLGLWFVIRICKGNKGKIGAVLSVFALVSVATQGVDLIWHINVVPMAMLLIFTGRVLMDIYNSYCRRLRGINKALYLGICIMLLIAGSLIGFFNGKISIHGNEYGRSVILFLVCAVIMSVAFSLLVMSLKKSRILTFIGNNTLFYMGVHKPVLLILESLFRKQDDSWQFILVSSIICFIGLIPFAWFFNNCFPYTCGNITKKESPAFKAGKYVMLTLCGVVPYFYLIEDLVGDNMLFNIIAWAFYCIIVIAAERVFTKIMPFMFLCEKAK